MKKKKSKGKPVAKPSKSSKWVDPMEKRHRDMLGLNGPGAYEKTFG